MKMRTALLLVGVACTALPAYAQVGDVVNAPLNFRSLDAATLKRARITAPADAAGGIDLSRVPLDQLRRLAPEVAKLANDVRFLRRCGTHIDPGTKRAVRIRDSLRRLLAGDQRLPETIKVPVRFHVIHSGTTGKLTAAQVRAQIAKLNEVYSGHHIEFELRGDPDYSDNSTWFRMRVHDTGEPAFPEELEAKQHFVGNDPANGVERNLHIYSAEPVDPNPFVGGILGFATFPWEQTTNGALDGVVIRHSSIPGGDFPYDKGLTLVHEVGHYLGLYHTFQDGCSNQGDEVADTPAQADGENIFDCDETLDTCHEEPGLDPVKNYMNYVADACMNAFTPGQLTRIKTMVQDYRPEFVVGGH